MEKRVIFLFICIIILIPIALAETLLHSGKVTTDKDTDIKGNMFRFTYDEKSDKTFVQNQFSNLIINKGECKSNNLFRVCIDKANFSYKDTDTYKYYYELEVRVYKLVGSLDITHTADSSTLLQGETSEFKVIIKNPTDFDVTDIIYKENLSIFVLANVKGCALQDGNLVWRGSLKPKYEQSCTATLTPQTAGMFSLAGNLSYFNSLDTESKKTDTLKITVLPKQLKISYTINKGSDKDLEVSYPFNFTVTAANINKDESIDLIGSIKFPANIEIVKSSQDFDSETNSLKLNKRLKPLETINYTLNLNPLSKSNAPMEQNIFYTIKNVNDKIDNKTYIDFIEPEPVIELIADNANITLGQKFTVVAKIRNPSKYHDIENINAVLNVPFNYHAAQNAGRISPNQSYIIISNTFISPDNIDTEEYSADINFTMNYNIYGKAKTSSKSMNIKILGKGLEAKSKETKEDAGLLEQNKTDKPEIQVIEADSQKNNKKIIIIAVLAGIIIVLVILVFIYKGRKKL